MDNIKKTKEKNDTDMFFLYILHYIPYIHHIYKICIFISYRTFCFFSFLFYVLLKGTEKNVYVDCSSRPYRPR